MSSKVQFATGKGQTPVSRQLKSRAVSNPARHPTGYNQRWASHGKPLTFEWDAELNGVWCQFGTIMRDFQPFTIEQFQLLKQSTHPFRLYHQFLGHNLRS
jgi:hypothetical protein